MNEMILIAYSLFLLILLGLQQLITL